MNAAQQIVETLLEGDDKKMPPWLKKKISGKGGDDEAGDDAKDGEETDGEEKAPKSTASDVAGGPKENGVGKAKDGEGKVEHTF